MLILEPGSDSDSATIRVLPPRTWRENRTRRGACVLVTARRIFRLGRRHEIAVFGVEYVFAAIAVGRLNPAAGFGEWPQALEFIRELSS
jgi:hypothetical protein